ncbi:MAG: DNA polymerase III subunit gamma/tau [Defluviitaleaceae bacterium]|nr:DNA polymerase III subunit gamma/tau [Defluviitaleaceae bacterium]
MVGQRHIVKTLTNQIINGRISHAYLFCGVRGTGKTSCAKIFARTVNCENQQDGEACGTCPPCIDIARGASLDVVEIDAASNNGVDNIRDLREEVRYPPNGKYKVYIIDEVHMLSTGAFNALLKTLEEPPPHVIFILATTDPQKIPATIHSRLMRFDFHRISQHDMREALAGYMAEEGINISGDALDYVVQISDGGMRDALSLLDRLAGLYFDQEITLSSALEVTGSMSQDVFFDLFNALVEGNTTASLAIIEDISAKGRDFAQFAEEFLGHLRNMMINAVTEDKKEQVPHFVPMITHFAGTVRNIKQAGSNARLILEVACIEYQLNSISSHMPHPTLPPPAAAIAKPTPAPPIITPPPVDEAPPWEDIPWGDDVVAAPPEPTPPVATNIVCPVTELPVAAPSPQHANTESPQQIQNALENWQTFAQSLSPPTLAAYAKKAHTGHLGSDVFYLICDDNFTKSQLTAKTEALAQKMAEAFGGTFNITVIDQAAYNQLYEEKHGKTQADPQWEEDLAELKSLINFDIKII